MTGKTIRIYLVDGVPTGTLTAEIMNWTGKVVVFSRSQLADVARRDEAHRTGVYFLVGADPGAPTREWVYIGEADDVLKRLAIHDRDESRDFWQRTVVVVSKDENLTKAHARYLESRLIEMAQEANRARVVNGTAPPKPALPEADVADMEYFLDQVVMMMPVLGFGFLQPSPRVEVATAASPQSPVFRLSGAGVRAEARVIDGQFVVLKGSAARKQGVESWTSYKGLRAELIESRRIVDGSDPQLLVFADNVSFDSPSAAGGRGVGAEHERTHRVESRRYGEDVCRLASTATQTRGRRRFGGRNKRGYRPVNEPMFPSEVLHLWCDKLDGRLALLRAHMQAEECDDAIDLCRRVGEEVVVADRQQRGAWRA